MTNEEEPQPDNVVDLAQYREETAQRRRNMGLIRGQRRRPYAVGATQLTFILTPEQRSGLQSVVDAFYEDIAHPSGKTEAKDLATVNLDNETQRRTLDALNRIDRGYETILALKVAIMYMNLRGLGHPYRLETPENPKAREHAQQYLTKLAEVRNQFMLLQTRTRTKLNNIDGIIAALFDLAEPYFASQNELNGTPYSIIFRELPQRQAQTYK